MSPFVKLRHIRFGDRDYFERMREVCAEHSHAGERVDFVDGTVFGRDEMYLTLGTFVEDAPATIGASGNDARGVTGVNWKTKIMPVKVLDDTGIGSDADIAAGFAYAAQNGATIVNASLGGSGSSPVLADAVAQAPDTLFVVSAGNGGDDGVGDDNDTAPRTLCNIDSPNLVCVRCSRRLALADYRHGISAGALQSAGSCSPTRITGPFVSGGGPWADESLRGAAGGWNAPRPRASRPSSAAECATCSRLSQRSPAL